MQPPAAEAEKDLRVLQVGAQVRVMLWLGLEKDQNDWTKCCATGEVAVFAETVSMHAQPCNQIYNIAIPLYPGLPVLLKCEKFLCIY